MGWGEPTSPSQCLTYHIYFLGWIPEKHNNRRRKQGACNSSAQAGMGPSQLWPWRIVSFGSKRQLLTKSIASATQTHMYTNELWCRLQEISVSWGNHKLKIRLEDDKKVCLPASWHGSSISGSYQGFLCSAYLRQWNQAESRNDRRKLSTC